MTGLLERLGVEVPIFQAGMGGGIAGHELAAAVSEAGGLGTIGILDPPALHEEIQAARALTGKAIAVNLLLPFARPGHWTVASEADAVVTFWGRPRRQTNKVWIHQCGSVEEALEAHAAGADAVIAQGIEAGGHVRSTTPALVLLERVRLALPEEFPVLLAGGVGSAGDVKRALDHGAAAAVAGTRFVLTDECRAHPAYKQRLDQATETVLTELFGAGWPDAPHRVISNAATERWLGGDLRGPAWVRALNRRSAPVLSRLSASAVARVASRQRGWIPFYGPVSPLAGDSSRMVDAAPLYAGESVARIRQVQPAGELTRRLAP